MSLEVLVSVEGVSKKFCRRLKRSLLYGVQDVTGELLGRRGNTSLLRPDEFWATKDVSFQLRRGECLGLVGRNGAGKTTLLRMLNGLIKPDEGQIRLKGRVGALIALGAGFNPVLTGRENIYVNAAVLGLGKAEIDEKLDGIIAFSELEEFIDAPVQSYSSGMQVRLGFAIATAMKPDVLLLDEVLAVGDTAFRAKCFQRIGELLSDTAVIFVSHDQNQMARICNRVLYLEKGRVHYSGPTMEGLNRYRKSHQYEMGAQIISSPAISEPHIELLTPNLEWGANLELELHFFSEEVMGVGMVLIHLFREEGFVCHSEVPCQSTQVVRGWNRWKIDINNLHLVQGRFYISVSIFSSDKKQTILQMLHACDCEMSGSSGYGPPILLSASMETLQGISQESIELE